MQAHAMKRGGGAVVAMTLKLTRARAVISNARQQEAVITQSLVRNALVVTAPPLLPLITRLYADARASLCLPLSLYLFLLSLFSYNVDVGASKKFKKAGPSKNDSAIATGYPV